MSSSVSNVVSKKSEMSKINVILLHDSLVIETYSNAGILDVYVSIKLFNKIFNLIT